MSECPFCFKKTVVKNFCGACGTHSDLGDRPYSKWGKLRASETDSEEPATEPEEPATELNFMESTP